MESIVFLNSYHFCSKNINFVCFGSFLFISFHFLAVSCNVDLAATDYLLKMNGWTNEWMNGQCFKKILKILTFVLLMQFQWQMLLKKNLFPQYMSLLGCCNNYHKVNILYVCRSEALNGSYWVLAGVRRHAFLSAGSRRESILLPLAVLETAHFHWLMAPLLYQVELFLTLRPLWFSLGIPSFTFKDHCDYTGLIQSIQDYLPVKRSAT